MNFIRKPRVLFLCTGNSCRSQMAEGFARHRAGDRAEILSAGIQAHGKNPRAIAAMAEVGIDISGQESNRLNDDVLADCDLVVTVCGHADEHCPVLPPGTRRVHWPLPDPAKATGNEEKIQQQFRAVRDDIAQRVRELIDQQIKPSQS